jgi:formylglycine-generating enzyme required for sulfatase activity
MPKMLELEFVRIPAGEFLIGSDRSVDRLAEPEEMPCHRLTVSDYYITRFPVTNEQYRIFVSAAGHRTPLSWKKGLFPQDKADHPVVGVSFLDALQFCCWAAEETGLPIRLPTEPEWEKAARGTDGRLYPWGDQWKKGRCNSREEKLSGTTPVGRFSPQGDSPFGVAEMGGNVQEWILSLFKPYPYDPSDGREILVDNTGAQGLLPMMHETGCTSVPQSLEASLDKSMLRGGSWREVRAQSRCAYRSWAAPMHRSDDTGLRCCYEP